MSQQLALNINFGQGISDAFGKVMKFVPQFIGFLVILAIGWFVAKAIAKIADKVLRKVGSERIAERAGTRRMLAGSQYDTTGIVVKIIYYAILLMALQLAFGVFGPNPISVLIAGIVAWLPRAIVAVVIVVVAMAIANGVRDIIGNMLSSASYGKTVATIAWAFIVVLGAFAALGQAGIATTIISPLLWAGLAALAGIAIVGVGGGLITPMRSRWERWLDSAERESVNARGHMSAYQAGRTSAMEGQPMRTDRPLGQGGSMGGGSTGQPPM